MQPQAANFEASAALAGADSRSLALLTLRVSFRLPHLSITPKGLRHFMAPQALKRAVNHEKIKKKKNLIDVPLHQQHELSNSKSN